MWLNSMQREEPYLVLTCISKLVKASRTQKCVICTGAAWLSSARAVRCTIQLVNERNPCKLLVVKFYFITLFRLPYKIRRKVGTTSSQYGPYDQGCTRTTMSDTARSNTARWRKSLKVGLSSDWRLQLASMKMESLVMAHQHRCREYVPGSCTHRPSHHGNRLYSKCAN
jgi:hypothetical protein